MDLGFTPLFFFFYFLASAHVYYLSTESMSFQNMSDYGFRLSLCFLVVSGLDLLGSGLIRFCASSGSGFLFGMFFDLF